MNKIQKARNFAFAAHEAVNQKYDGQHPYSVHLEMAFFAAVKFIHILKPNEVEDVLCAVYCHDLIEDCRLSYNDVKRATNEKVANLVYAVTNEKGKTREERANEKYYAGIVLCQNATFVKLCDRIANIEYGVEQLQFCDQHRIVRRTKMPDKYEAENLHFLQSLNLYSKDVPSAIGTKYLPMVDYIFELFKQYNDEKNKHRR